MTPDRTALRAAEEALLGIELATADTVSGILMPAWRRLLALAIALWPGDDATPDEKQRVLDAVRLNSLQPRMALVRQAIKDGARQALAHGLKTAQDEALIAGVRVVLPPSALHVSADIHERVDALERTMREQVAAAQSALDDAETLVDVQVAMGVAKQGINRSEAVARYATNQASNDALTEVSHATDDLVSIWHAERDACLHCLAYQGRIDTGHGFPEGLTFDKHALDTGPVDNPPLHPNCRCSVWLVHKDVAQPLADSLEREAERSVLRGWSRPSESNNARIQAAQRLLNVGTDLPKSVKAYAERAIKRGEFGRGRTPPA